MWVRSGVQLLRSEVSRLVFLGRVELGVQKLGYHCALNSRKDPVESLERKRKGSGSGCNVLVAIDWRGRIPGYLAYGRRAKWNPVGSVIRSPPTDRALSDPGCYRIRVAIVRQNILEKGGKSLRDLQTRSTLECCESQFPYPGSG